jgi:hypothetical protein
MLGAGRFQIGVSAAQKFHDRLCLVREQVAGLWYEMHCLSRLFQPSLGLVGVQHGVTAAHDDQHWHLKISQSLRAKHRQPVESGPEVPVDQQREVAEISRLRAWAD